MTFARRIHPEHFLLSDWDDAWSQGWFRMRQTLFTTHFLEFDRQFHSAVWLRVGLEDWTGDRRLEELEKRNRRFRLVFYPLPVSGPSDAHEALYQRYRKSVPFEPAPTLKDLLYGDAFRNLFPSWVADLFDGDTLVASGIFDLGESAAAGINAYYDPDYRKFSLGTYLIYKKMEFCRDQGLRWFYPGYVAPGQPRFDYKWNLGAAHLEYLDLGTGVWLPRNPSDPVPDPLAEMVERLRVLKELWRGPQPGPSLRWYLHLDINLNPQVRGMGLFDFPVFLDWPGSPGGCPPVVAVYDPRDGLYHLLHCRSVYQFELTDTDPAIFDGDLMFVDQLIFSSSDADEFSAVLAGLAVVVA